MPQNRYLILLGEDQEARLLTIPQYYPANACRPKMKLGNAIASVATPIARVMGLDCIDPVTNELRPESPCAQRKRMLNDFSDRMYDALFKPKNQKMKITYQATLTISDVEDALEVARILAPLTTINNVKVGAIMARPDPRPQTVNPPIHTIPK